MKNQLLEKIAIRILETNELNGSMVQFEIEGITYDVDYKATIETKDGMQSDSYDTPNDNEELTVTIHEVEIRNIFDKDGEMLELGTINKQFYIL